jgi:preprotein translocase subunit SecG
LTNYASPNNDNKLPASSFGVANQGEKPLPLEAEAGKQEDAGEGWLMYMNKFLGSMIVLVCLNGIFLGVATTLLIQEHFFSDDPLPSLLVMRLFFALSIILIFISRRQAKHAHDEDERIRLENEQKIAEFEARLAKEENPPQPCDGKGLPAVVCQLRREGKSEKEIAEYLSDKKQWCSNPQIGALLHENTEVSKVTSDAMTKYAQRLLDKA